MSTFYSEFYPLTSAVGIEGRARIDLTTATLADLYAQAVEYSAVSVYTKGDLAYNQNAIWVYINSISASGNAPPTLPTTHNTYWELVGSMTTNTFVWTAYANSADGVTFTNFTTGSYDQGGIIRKWIGIAVNKTSATESADISDYSWTKIIGEDGTDGTDGSDGISPISLVLSPASKLIPCDHLGNPKVTSLPTYTTVTVTQAGADVTSTSTINLTNSGCSASYSGGTISITSVTASSAYIDVAVTYYTQSTTIRLPINKLNDPAPVTSTQIVLSASNLNETSGSYITTGPMISLVAPSSGRIDCAIDLSYLTTSGLTYSMAGKVQWRVLGGSWADITTETVGTTTIVDGEGNPELGFLELPSTTYYKSGLTVGSTYEFQFLSRKYAGTDSGSGIDFYGVFTVAQGA